MTRPPCVRLSPAYPGNPRTRIEGESPPFRKGTYGLRSGVFAASRRMKPPKLYDLLRDYFDAILVHCSFARVFSAFQSVAATSQLTMVRLFCATWPLATLDVFIES